MPDLPYIDCTVPITTIRPFKGCVLLELLPPSKTESGIVFPEIVGGRAGAGKVVAEMDKFPGQEALVRKLGPPDPKNPFEVNPGDRVIVRYYAGTNMRQSPRRYKLVKGTDIEAVFV